MKGTMKLADHAELWWTKQGKELPARGTPEWKAMYETWANWAFPTCGEKANPRSPILTHHRRHESERPAAWGGLST